MIGPDDALRELWVLERPEAEQTILKLPIVGAVYIILAIADDDEVRILHIDIDRGYHTCAVLHWIKVTQLRNINIFIWLTGCFTALECE